MKTRRISRARWLTLGLAALWLTTQLSVFAHLAFVPHVTCVEHGELIDAGAQLAVATPHGEGVEHDTVTLLLVSPSEHSHEHCLLTAMRRVSARLSKATVSLEPGAPAESVAPARGDRPVPPAIALLDVAPKSSPPAA